MTWPEQPGDQPGAQPPREPASGGISGGVPPVSPGEQPSANAQPGAAGWQQPPGTGDGWQQSSPGAGWQQPSPGSAPGWQQQPQPGGPQGWQQQPQGWPQQPGWPPPQPPSRKNTGLIVGVVAAVVVLVAAFAVTGFVTPGFLLPTRNGSGTAVDGGAPATSPSEPPPGTGLPGAPPPSGDVTIPTTRTPEPHRATPLPDPSTCSFPADPNGPGPKPATRPVDGPQPASGTVGVTLRTTAGDIVLSLDRALAPCTVASFVSLANQGFYTGTKCHRLGVTDLQMLQCGDPAGDGTGGPGYTVPDEFFPGLAYGRGLIALANTGRPGTGGSQFFMMFGNTPIPPTYTVFGSISDGGLAVLDKVAQGGVASAGSAGDDTGPPRIPVVFNAVTVG
jgi:peptidyl-prolyl cis-trans isomerase B (cyclophilin B)